MTGNRVLAIYGASHHGRVVADAALAAGWSGITFFDRRYPELQKNGPWAVEGNFEALVSRLEHFDGVIMGLGENVVRLQYHRKLVELKAPIATIVHPWSWISPRATIGAGSFVASGVSINIGARLGSAVIVNTGATVDHDCILEDGVHISPGVNLAGDVRVGERTWVGVGSSVRQSISIGADTMVGAGAVVVSDLPSAVLAVGCPARFMPKPESTT